MISISVIIPVLNEAQIIGELLQHLLKNLSLKFPVEIIVVDGGSTDGTVQQVNDYILRVTQSQSANKQLTLSVLNAPKGRAKQMNLGAKNANGELFYFLHSDSFPPQHFDTLISAEINKGNKAGCFRMRFNSSHWWLRLASWLTQFNWRACRGGDQSLFITKSLFWDIGGYNESFPIYEDNILINELYQRKQFVVINKKLTTSARLYEKIGVWKLQYHFWTIYVKRWFGASADDIYAYYQKYISKA